MYETFDNEYTWRAHLHFDSLCTLPHDLRPEALKREFQITKESELSGTWVIQNQPEVIQYWCDVDNMANWAEVSRGLGVN